ncbi:hypothetical protein CSV63_02760 [Sporosarcina sp. P34]|uniref:hypothetical protein n=1 Tax=Sporosarcina sp. P34 TaxID=2048247 RepID=UPI000C167117|nr:hypothetical protein [Sporosarcina sp. P34]PID16825.1 hypothetical protein CSV63_02760 [Sporosarcina sp. P34]
MVDFLVFVVGLVFMVGTVMLIWAFIKKKPKKKAAIITGIGFVLVAIVGSLLPETEDDIVAEKEKVVVDSQTKNDSNSQTENIDVKKEKKTEVNVLDVSGKIKASASQGVIDVNVKTNIPDGGLIKLSILDNELKTIEDYATVENGEISKTMKIPEDRMPGEYMVSAFFNFDDKQHPQPEEIKNTYGNKGEKITGDLEFFNSIDGKNADFEPVNIPYPSPSVVEEKKTTDFENSILELIELSGGIITKIYPAEEDWSIVKVVVSDTWYISADHEKERFVEQVGGTIEKYVIGAGKTDGVVHTYFVDSYGKELATPKILGGYKIKR